MVVFWFLLGISLGVEFWVIYHFTFNSLRNWLLFQSGGILQIPPAVFEGSSFSQHLSLSVLFSIFYWVCSGITLWFWFAFLWWLTTLSIISYAHWPFVCLEHGWLFLNWNSLTFYKPLIVRTPTKLVQIGSILFDVSSCGWTRVWRFLDCHLTLGFIFFSSL